MNPFSRVLLAVALWAPMAAVPQELESLPPVVLKTVPEAGAKNVAPGVTELKVTFNKPMKDGSWSWASAWSGSEPEVVGRPQFDETRRTCAIQVRLAPGRTYAYWLNSEKFKNFKDTQGHPAVPYLLSFQTAGDPVLGRVATPAARPQEASPSPLPSDPKLNDEQRRVLAWTDRQFSSYFDSRTFEDWSVAQREELETKMLEALQGPPTREFYRAIGSLAALRSTNVNTLERLRQMSFERRDKNNRDRWMAIRALGLMSDKTSIPEMIHLVYHGNVNTRWWAQISLVRLTGHNFGKDWNAWGKWWNESGGQPRFNPQVIRWWEGQAEPDQLASSLEEKDAKFFADLPPIASR